MTKLTWRQAQVLDFISKFMGEAQRPPTRAEIARHFGWASANAAEDVLTALQRKGAVRLIRGTARGIEVV